MRADSVDRRRFLRAVASGGVGAVASVAGCTDLAADDDTLEIQHYWVEDDGGAAMDRLLADFRTRYPEVDVVENPIAGGADENLQDVVSGRVRSGNPPSTWQTWAGPNLRPFVDAGVLRDLEGVVFDASTREAYLDIALEAATLDGTLVTVPINVHRINNCFYRPPILEAAGVDPDAIDSLEALLAAFEAVETETDAIATVQQTSAGWSTAQLWELAVLSAAGTDAFERLVAGDVDREAVRNALEWVVEASAYLPDDADAITWTRANRRFREGDVAFYVQGDWAGAVYGDGFEYGTDWDVMAFPGTDGLYLHNIDSFPFPKSNPTPDVTESFLAFCTEPETQATFNRRKSSLPPRSDAPTDDFGPFLRHQLEAFETATATPPAIANGRALTPSVKADVDAAFAVFVDDWDVDAATDALVAALAR